MSPFRLACFLVTVATMTSACKEKPPAPPPEDTPKPSGNAAAAGSAEVAVVDKAFAKPQGSCLGYPAQHMCTEFFSDGGKKTCQVMHTWVEGGHCKQDDKTLGSCEVVSDMGVLKAASKKVYYELDGDNLESALTYARDDCKAQADELFSVASRTWKDGPGAKAKAAGKGDAPKPAAKH